MTTNFSTSPNAVKHSGGDHIYGTHFGRVSSVTPICLPGNGHEPHIDIRFTGGILLAFCPETMAEIIRRGQEALAALGHLPEIRDAVGGV